LEFESCRKIDSLTPLEGLSLRYLGVNACGGIESFAPLESLQDLEILHAWESTEVLDGKLEPLLYLPHLREVA
jgi:hypothetical protein